MDRHILQKVEFYRWEEKRLRLYFDQFCNLLSLKHVLQYRFNQIMWANVLKRHSRRIKGQKKAQIPQNLTTLKQKRVAPHVFEYMDRQILLCRVQSVDPYTQNSVRLHNLTTKVIPVISAILQGSGQIKICRSKNSKWGLLLRTCKIKFFVTLNMAFRMTFLH